MEIIIKETGERKELTRRDDDGVDWAAEVIGQEESNLTRDEDGAYILTQEQYAWWTDLIEDLDRMDNRITVFKARFGHAAVQDCLSTTGAMCGPYIAAYPGKVQESLDEWFDGIKPTFREIAESRTLWDERIDPDGMDPELFDVLDVDDKMDLIYGMFGLD